MNQRVYTAESLIQPKYINIVQNLDSKCVCLSIYVSVR